MKREKISRRPIKTSLVAVAVSAAILLAVAPAMAGKSFGYSGTYTVKQSGNCNASNGPLTCVNAYTLSNGHSQGEGLPKCVKGSTESGNVTTSDGPKGMVSYSGSLTLACTKVNYVIVKIAGAYKAGINTVGWSVSSGHGAYSTASGSGSYSITFDIPKLKYTDTYTNTIKL